MNRRKPRRKGSEVNLPPREKHRKTGAQPDSLSIDLLTDSLRQERGLPAHPSSQALQQHAILRLQRDRGNHMLRQALEQLAGRETADIQREVTEEEAELGLAGLEVEETLEGHPLNAGDVMREPGSTFAVQTSGKSGGITANIELKPNPPTIVKRPEATLNAKYGANIAGWTKPKINIKVLPGTGKTINLEVILKFTMELAQEYSGGRLAILQDHENGHVTIATQAAETHAVTGLKKSIEALKRLRRGPLKRLLKVAVKKFEAAEGKKSKAYDKVDYPRMKLAYYGEKTPLADLSKSYPNIKTLVSSITAFNSTANLSNFGSMAGTVLTAHKALKPADLARLQYNPAFKKLVASSAKKLSALKKTLGKADKAKADSLTSALETFTWSPAV